VNNSTPRPACRHGTLSRFRALSEAVREHERAASNGVIPRRRRDLTLYEALEAIENSLPLSERDRNLSSR
jgi:hypothetical protein